MEKTKNRNGFTLEYKTVHPVAQRSQNLRERAMRTAGPSNPLEALRRAAETPERLSSEALIREAIDANFRQVASERTLAEYERELDHFALYLDSVRAVDFYSAKRKDIQLFMNHLKDKGGSRPAASRLSCSWCRDHGYPDGRDGRGWSASSRKGSLSAIRFLYNHFLLDDDLPEINPSFGIPTPRVINKAQWTPTRQEVKTLLEHRGTRRSRLLVHWAFYTPSRRQPFSDARWRDIDLDGGTWTLLGKGGKPDRFDMPTALVAEFRSYRKWILSQADKNSAIREALMDEETAFVFLTKNGRQVHAQQLAKELKRHGLDAGVGVFSIQKSREYPYGKTSKLSPHALRRAWAYLALNDPKAPQPIDVVSEVLRHSDIKTTRVHYARTKPERARSATKNFKL